MWQSLAAFLDLPRSNPDEAPRHIAQGFLEMAEEYAGFAAELWAERFSPELIARYDDHLDANGSDSAAHAYLSEQPVAVIERVLDGWRPRDAYDPNLSKYYTFKINDAHKSLFAHLHWRARERSQRIRQEADEREAALLTARVEEGWAPRGDRGRRPSARGSGTSRGGQHRGPLGARDPPARAEAPRTPSAKSGRGSPR